MKQIIFTALIFLLSVKAYADRKPTAYLNITVNNFPALIIERFTYFQTGRDISVEKNGLNTFLVKFFGDKPQLYYINFHEVLISPKDSVNIVYEQSPNSSGDNQMDEIRVTGTKTENYTYSNFNKNITSLRYGKVEKFDMEKHGGAVDQYFRKIKETFLSSKNKTIDSIKALKIDSDLKSYLVKREDLKLCNEFLNISQTSIMNPSDKGKLVKTIDSLYSEIKFVSADTAYAYYSEILMKNYFTFAVKYKYNSLKTKEDFSKIINWLKSKPEGMERNYFSYFLSKDHQKDIQHYDQNELFALIANNPNLTRERYIYNNKNHMYWVDNPFQN